jgi:hypothetical protein
MCLNKRQPGNQLGKALVDISMSFGLYSSHPVLGRQLLQRDTFRFDEGHIPHIDQSYFSAFARVFDRHGRDDTEPNLGFYGVRIDRFRRHVRGYLAITEANDQPEDRIS